MEQAKPQRPISAPRQTDGGQTGSKQKGQGQTKAGLSKADEAAAYPALCSQEVERYARHIVMPEIGGAGQQRLKSARILMVGAGGLGAPVLQYLAAAGVGTLGVADDDVVTLSNLQRQTIFSVDNLGMAKTAAAADFIGRLNPHVTVSQHSLRLSPANALELIGEYDLVVDGCDNFATRYLVSDACFFARKPLISGAVSRFDGSLTLLKPYLADDAGRPHPTYRCLNPKPPSGHTLLPCAQAGILGAAVGVTGSLMAVEAVREIIALDGGLLGQLLLFDARSMRFARMQYRHTPTNPLSGASRMTFTKLHPAS